jgi:hypothetical protein
MKHEKNFFAYPGERMLFGGQYGAPGAQAKAAAAAASDARDAAAAAAGFEENSDQYETEPDSETECSPAGGAPPPKRARITGASPAVELSVPLAYLQSEVEYARAREADAKEWARMEVDRARKEAEAREAEWKAMLKEEVAEWKAETKRAREETERQRNESKEEVTRLRAEVEKAREETERVRAKLEQFHMEKCTRVTNVGGNMRRVQIVLDHVKAHYSRFASYALPPAALQIRDVQTSGCFTVRHCESLLVEQQPDLRDSGARAREVFRLVTDGCYLPPTGARSKDYGVEVFFAEGVVAFYNGAEKSGVRWEHDSATGWRASLRI